MQVRQGHLGTPIMTLAEFLLARIADDEATARNALPAALAGDPEPEPIWQHRGDGYIFIETPDDPLDYVVVYDEGSPSDEEAGHIVRWQPRRVLAECETKRHIVAECARWSEMDPYCSPIDMSSLIADEFLLLLAQPYADHPDYREEWRV